MGEEYVRRILQKRGRRDDSSDELRATQTYLRPPLWLGKKREVIQSEKKKGKESHRSNITPACVCFLYRSDQRCNRSKNSIGHVGSDIIDSSCARNSSMAA